MSEKQMPGSCPACGKPLEVSGLTCPECRTQISGRFPVCSFCRLSPEDRRFIAVFLMARGNIRGVERILGISYPTVRNRLQEVTTRLGLQDAAQDEAEERQLQQKRREILKDLEDGQITAEEAARKLRELSRK